MSITPEWMVGRVPTIDPATGRLPVEYVPEEIGAAVAHVDEVAGRASASASAAAESAGQAQQSAQAAWNAMASGTHLVPDPIHPGLYLPTAGSSMIPDPALDGLYTIGPLA